MNTENPRYRPVSVQDATDYDPMKGTIRVKRVNYRLADGTQSYVIVPHSEYSVETVTRMLEEAAQQHEEVMAIKGQTRYGGPVMETNPFG